LNLGHEEALSAYLAGCSGVVNLIAILHERKRGQFDAVHVGLAGRLARAARTAGVERLVHISAIGADPNSSSAYARTKAGGERAVHEAFPDATILRPSVVFGPEDQFLNRFAGMARMLPALPLIGGGRTRFQPVYVGDVADAIVAGLEREEAAGQTYELGGPQVYSFEELMRWLLRTIGRKRLLLPISFQLAKLQGQVLEYAPEPPLTRDQVELLKYDNVVSEDAKTLADLGVRPTPMELIAPEYLQRHAAHPRQRVISR
ncbi:MAG: complex I NDUFA9 subunit family protein, partial [Geminicoccaceae bacterium]|nr:complex I NDUFA9 subunit family protein [Geminicoccaceae bacterium]